MGNKIKLRAKMVMRLDLGRRENILIENCRPSKTS